MHYEPISCKPLLFIPTTFNENPSTGIACLDIYMGANLPTSRKPATNIRGKLLHMSTDQNCSPTVKSDIQKFNEYCEKLGLLPLESLFWHESRAESFESTSPVVPDNLDRQVVNPQTNMEEESNDVENIPDDSGCLKLQEEHDGEEESGSEDFLPTSSSDDDMDAYLEYLYPDTSLHRSQIDCQPLPQVSYASGPVYFINPFTPSETIEPIDSFEPTESSSSEKCRNTSFEAASNPRKKARKDYSYPSAFTSTSTSSSSFSDYGEKETITDTLSEFPPGHPKSPFRKNLCKDGGFKYTCRKCPDFSTRATGDMRRHMESLAHKPKKDHICKYPKCGGSFTRKDALKRHQMSKKHFV